MTSNESGIIRKAQNGDRQAFARLVNLYTDRLFNLAFRLVGNRTEAEDIVQESFLRLYRHIGSYDENYKFSTWLYRITSNLCIDHLRKRRAALSLDGDADADEGDGTELYQALPSEEKSPETAVMERETSAEIQRAIHQLPPSYRSVIVLKYVNDLPLQDIADILSIPVSTVKTRLHRGREALRRLLQ